jgi:dihydrofolate synthase/folylpolyglutamate synthase
VGLYTSPHLCTFRERIQVAGEPVPESVLLAAARRLWPAIVREEASFFEATTALAFLIFAEAGVDLAVVEVGLGGRLDATNVLEPDLVVLTNVAVDHIDYLGSSLESIATEKAGIIKAGVPVVTGERDAGVLAIFSRRAEEVGAPCYRLAEESVGEVGISAAGTHLLLRSELWGTLELQTPLIGEHQARNTALALRALEKLPAALLPPRREEVVRGVANVRWPGRLQWEQLHGRDWIFDVAHNPAGMAALVGSLSRLPVPRPLVAVVGILGDKDWGLMLPMLQGCADYLVLTTPPTAPAERGWDPERAVSLLPAGQARVISEFRSALEAARVEAATGTVLVTGSFHTVGDAQSILGLAPYGADPALPHTLGVA